jgi:hypothetical protein
VEESDMKRGMKVRLNSSILELLKAAGMTILPIKVTDFVTRHVIKFRDELIGLVIVDEQLKAVRVEMPASSIFRNLEHVHDECTDDGPEHVPACIICEKEGVRLHDGLCPDHYGELVDHIANES